VVQWIRSPEWFTDGVQRSVSLEHLIEEVQWSRSAKWLTEGVQRSVSLEEFIRVVDRRTEILGNLSVSYIFHSVGRNIIYNDLLSNELNKLFNRNTVYKNNVGYFA